MRAFVRTLKRHFGISAEHVAVKPEHAWYWRLLFAAVLILLGYGMAYWQLTGGGRGANIQQTIQENQTLQTRIVQTERQLQVERAAQSNLAKELVSLQDEGMQLKEDVAFYKSILNEYPGESQVKLYSFKLSKSGEQGKYDYRILLLQSGRHEKMVQGRLNLSLIATQSGKPVVVPVAESAAQPIKINFKYYQRVEGSFSIPADASGQAVEASFVELGANQPKITQRVDLPG